LASVPRLGACTRSSERARASVYVRLFRHFAAHGRFVIREDWYLSTTAVTVE
jgi:hypothetical protein